MAKLVKVKGITVHSKKDGFRRCGRAFPISEPTKIALEDLKRDELEQLKKEPMLVVVEGEIEGEAPAAA